MELTKAARVKSRLKKAQPAAEDEKNRVKPEA